MLVRKALLGLATLLVVVSPGLACAEPPAAKTTHTGSTVWTTFAAGAWELVLERLTFPLGTATLRERDAELKW